MCRSVTVPLTKGPATPTFGSSEEGGCLWLPGGCVWEHIANSLMPMGEQLSTPSARMAQQALAVKSAVLEANHFVHFTF